MNTHIPGGENHIKIYRKSVARPHTAEKPITLFHIYDMHSLPIPSQIPFQLYLLLKKTILLLLQDPQGLSLPLAHQPHKFGWSLAPMPPQAAPSTPHAKDTLKIDTQ